jgi:hypothetical protein
MDLPSCAAFIWLCVLPSCPLHLVTCPPACVVHAQGATLGCGVPAAWPQCPAASQHASIVQKLLNKGLSIAGQGSTQPLNYPTLGDNMRNPAVRFRVAGGGATGAVAAVAKQQAHLAVGTDWLGSTRIPAACQGLAAFVCTPGVYAPSMQPAAAAADDEGSQPPSAERGINGKSSARSRRSNGVECAALATGDMGVLRRVCEQLTLPGVSDLRGELTQVVVAEDLFSLCDQDMEPGETQGADGRWPHLLVGSRSGLSRVVQRQLIRKCDPAGSFPTTIATAVSSWDAGCC